MPKSRSQRKNEALRIKRERIAMASQVGAGEDETTSIAVVANNLFSTHRNYFMIRGLNALLQTYPCIELIAYLHDTAVPMVAPHFPIFGIHALSQWNGRVIATDITTTLDAIESPATKILHYVFDLEPERRDLTLRRRCSAFMDPRVIVVCRSEDHWSVLSEEYGFTDQPRIIDRFDLPAMLCLLGESSCLS